MRTKWRGVLTVFLSLVLLPFLTFCLVLTEGVRMYFIRAKAQEAEELAEFSVLSEYQPLLLEKYGLFFLDLNYGKEQEQTAMLHSALGNYLTENAGEVSTHRLDVKNFSRATDGGGSVFFKQAVAEMKFRSGIGLLENMLPDTGEDAGEDDLLREATDYEAQAEEIVSGMTDEEGKPMFDISLPHLSFPSIDALTAAVFGDGTQLSLKETDLSERLLNRTLTEGAGNPCGKNFLDMQLFHGYLLSHFGYYGSPDKAASSETLEYQLEYVIAGEKSDRENVENVMWRIFLLRAGGIYLLFHSDSVKMAEAEEKAVLTVGVTGNAALVEIVRELFLLADAVEESISETRLIFQGEKLPVYSDGVLSGVRMGYREYLLLFLQTTKEREKLYRSMDVIELEIRSLSGNSFFKMDHCTDCFETEWTYDFDSLFFCIPVWESNVYRNTVKRKMYYEM